MKRAVLLSAFVIAAVTAVAAYTGTQALFSDTQSASGTVNAGTINLYITDVTGVDDAGENDNIFNATAENLLPGESTTWTIALRNDGNRPFSVSSDATGSSGFECDADNPGDDFSVTVTPSSIASISPGFTSNVDITVALDADADNDCQGDAFNVLVAFTANQIP